MDLNIQPIRATQTTTAITTRFFVYVLQGNPDIPAMKNKTYIGATVDDPEQRLAKHNQMSKHGNSLTGGAKRTTRWSNIYGPKTWHFLMVINGLPTWHHALVLEWHLGHVYRKRRAAAPKIYRGSPAAWGRRLRFVASHKMYQPGGREESCKRNQWHVVPQFSHPDIFL